MDPPPPPRRHSDPTSRNRTPANKFRRHSEVKRPAKELDLRQELSLNLNTGEVDNWLGMKFDEEDEENARDVQDYRFNHDIPLQRSISLDGGIEIFNYLGTLSSDWSDASSSTWTLNSNESDGRVLEQYRSFEDVPASQIKVRNRRASHAMWNDGKSNTALHVLKSYKGVETQSGGLSPQVKKLQKTFSFKSFFDESKETDKSFENILEQTDDEPKLEMRMPLVRCVSFESQMAEDGRNEESFKPLRQRRTGTTHNLWYEEARKCGSDLRREVLLKRSTSYTQFESTEVLAEFRPIPSGSTESVAKIVPNAFVTFKTSNEDHGKGLSNIRKLQSSFSSRTNVGSNTLTVPTIVVTHSDTCEYVESGIEENSEESLAEDNIAQSDTTTDRQVDEFESCNCRICTESDAGCGDDKSFLRNRLSKLFLKFASLIEFGKKLPWDVSEGEMYNCIMHVLKLMFGLWLRHLDHNPPVLDQGYGTVT